MATELVSQRDVALALWDSERAGQSHPPGPGQREAAWDEVVAARLLDLSANSRRAYGRDLRRWDEFLTMLGVHAVDATHTHGRAFARWLDEVCGYAPSTVARTLAGVSGTYADVQRTVPGLVHHNPLRHVRRPASQHGSPTPSLSTAEARAFLAAAEQVSLRAHALALLLLTTGVRISEALGADLSDLGIQAGASFSLRVARKGGRRELIAIPRPVYRALARYVTDRSTTGTALIHAARSPARAHEPLFAGVGARMTADEARREIERICLAAGWQRGRVTAHGLRATFATSALQDAGSPIRHVQQALGHATVTTTEVYLHDEDAGHRVVHSVTELLTS